MALLFTSSSLARSLIRILLIRLSVPPNCPAKPSYQPHGKFLRFQNCHAPKFPCCLGKLGNLKPFSLLVGLGRFRSFGVLRGLGNVFRFRTSFLARFRRYLSARGRLRLCRILFAFILGQRHGLSALERSE